jgi:hypothetical protein
MKAGPCREVFEVWQACVDGVLEAPASSSAAAPDDDGAASRKEAAVVCADVTRPLFECMSLHSDYYDVAAGAPKTGGGGGGEAAPAQGGGGGSASTGAA